MTRSSRIALAGMALLVVGVAPVAAKEGAQARVVTPVPREAVPGTRLAVVWTLSVRDEAGKPRAFNAEGVFVRVRGTRSSVDYHGVQHPLGRYRAVIRVPGGGIRSIRFGLMGWNDYGPAPMWFPVRGRVFR